MSTENASAAQGEALPTQQTATSAQPANPALEQEPNWLPARLDRERRTIAKKFGVESLDDAEKLIAKAREIEVGQLSEVEKLRKQAKDLESVTKQRDELATSLKGYAESLLAALTTEQKAAVEALAGDNPAAVVKTISSLRPTWQAQQAAQQAAAPLPAPASTTPAAPAAPNAAPNTAGPNHRQIWEGLKRTNPLAAAQYLVAHELEIFPQQAR